MKTALQSIFLAAAFFLTGGPAESAQLPDLTGVIAGTEGAPVSEATVFIYTAGPREGSSTVCPSCYADCRKHATTDAAGRFKIEALSTNLLFRVLVTAPGYRPVFKTKVDPFAGPTSITLEKRNIAGLGPKQALRGRVLDQSGKPVFGAVVNFDFFYGDEANCGGECEGVDHIAVTDRDGRFLLASEKRFDWMTVNVEARSFARQKFFQLASTETHDLKLSEGASVQGRVVKDGQPINGIEVGLVSVDRSENFTGDYSVATDANGRFDLVNIPPYHAYQIYTTMNSSGERGCVPSRIIRAAGDGTTRDTGDLQVQPGLRLTGRVVLSDGKRVPAHTRVQIGRRDAWDFQTVEAGEDGGFTATGLPPESCYLSVRVPGYTISARNESLDRLNGGSLMGLVEKDTDITVLLEPGEFKRPHPNQVGSVYGDRNPADEPLRGANAEK